MIRPLLLVSATGLATMIASFAIAAAIGPVDWQGFDWTGAAIDGGGPTTTRQMGWSGGDRLVFDVPADIAYTQGPQAKLVVTGPKGALAHLVMDGDALKYDARVFNAGRLKVVASGPSVSAFVVNGSGNLLIDGYDQDEITVRLNGSGDAKAVGQAKHVDVAIAGSGKIDVSGVSAEDANVRIAGSGDTKIAPKAAASVSIAGSGNVTLASRPKTLSTHIMGSGRIIQNDGAAQTVSENVSDAAVQVATAEIASDATNRATARATAEIDRAFGAGFPFDARRGRRHDYVQRVSGAGAVREMDWTGGDRLVVNVPADVVYVQGPQAKVALEGAPSDLDRVVLHGQNLSMASGFGPLGVVKITVTAPGVHDFTVNGVGSLKLDRYAQDSLRLRLRGVATVTGSGQARTLDLESAGAPEVDLSGLSVGDAHVRMKGAGEARLQPHGDAEVHITGAANATMTSRPRHLESHVFGPGGVEQPPETAKG